MRVPEIHDPVVFFALSAILVLASASGERVREWPRPAKINTSDSARFCRSCADGINRERLERFEAGAAVKDGLSARQQQRVEPADVRHVPSDRLDLEQRQSDRV